MKNIISVALVALQVAFLFFGLYPEFMVAFLAGAGFVTAQKGILAACVTTCEVDDISSDDACNVRGGIKVAYWAQYSDIDWAAMEASALMFNQTTQLILDYTMVGGAVFKKLEFEKKLGTYAFTYTSDADLYAILMTIVFEGKSSGNRNKFAKAVACCKLIVHVVDNNCTERVIGVEWDGVSFSPQITTLRIGRHLDTSGTLGSDKARDEIDFTGEALVAPLYSTAYTNSNIPL